MKSPLLDRRPFIPAKYAELRTEAVDELRHVVNAFCNADDEALARAVCNGQKIIRAIDDLWAGKAVP